MAAPSRTERERVSTRQRTESQHVQPTQVCQESSPSSLASLGSTSSLNDLFDPLDMELFHYYMMHTAGTLGDSTVNHVFLEEIPKLAFANLYLLHGLIAIAALHKASAVRSDRLRYIQKAVQSLNSGLPRLHSLIANLESEDPHAVTMYAGFVGLYAIGLPAAQFRDSHLETSLETLVDAFELVRGTATVINQTWIHVKQGPIGPLMNNRTYKNVEDLDYPPDKSETPRPDGFKAELLANLTAINTQVATHCDESEQCHYQHPILLLIRISQCYIPESSTCSLETPLQEAAALLMGWPARLSAEFLQYFRERRSPAVILVTYYSLFLRKEVWFHGDWRKWILDSLHELRLPEPWSSHRQWISTQVSKAPEDL